MPVDAEVDADNSVDVPPTACPLTDADLKQLRGTISPFDEDESFGVDNYLKVCSFVNTALNQ